MGGSSSASNSGRERNPGLPEDPASSIGQVGALLHTVIEDPRGHGSEACGDQSPAATENAMDEEGERNDHCFVVKETDVVDESGENGVNRDGQGAGKEQECEKAGQNPATEEGLKDRGKEGNNDKGDDENASNLDVGEHDKDAKSDENGEEDVEWDQEREENGTGNGQQKDCENESVYRNVEDEWVVTREEKEEVEVPESGKLEYPQRPDVEDCSFYIRTGICKFGLNCKFNHPVPWTNQVYLSV